MNGRTASQSDGTFQLAVLPSPGHLVVLLQATILCCERSTAARFSMVSRVAAGSTRTPLLACEPKPYGASLDVTVMLRPAIPVSGRVVGPDGQAIENAWMISRVCLAPSALAWRSWRANHHDTVKERPV